MSCKHFVLFATSVDVHLNPKFWEWSEGVTNWSKWAYRTVDATNIRVCSFVCYYEDRCDYYAHVSGKCHLGNFTMPRNPYNEDAATVFLKYGIKL